MVPPLGVHLGPWIYPVGRPCVVAYGFDLFENYFGFFTIFGKLPEALRATVVAKPHLDRVLAVLQKEMS